MSDCCNNISSVCVVGLGYIGMPTALSFAANGVNTIGVDKKAEILDSLRKKKLTFDEIGMDELLENAISSGKLSLSEECVESDVYIIAVPTPYLKVSKKIDPQYVVNAVEEVLDVAPNGAIIAIESTISPGTIDTYIRPLFDNNGRKLGDDIHVAHVPETIIPGNMIYELTHNNRIIGVDDQVVGEKLKRVYGTVCRGEIVITDIRTAEMAKVVQNAYRDINIAFANELAKICDKAKVDVHELINTANLHPRVNIMNPGPGVGGHCISVDPWFLVGDFPDVVNVIKGARIVNDSMPEFVLDKISIIMRENNISDLSRVGFYGITYKENVDDVRESPTLQIIECMDKHLAKGARYYDPMVKKRIVDNQYFDFEEFLDGIELVVIMVAHKHIIENQESLKGILTFDTRKCINIPDYKL